MSSTSWIIEGNVDSRWPINNCGNIGEVFPEVLTKLGFELGVIPAERAWREAYRDLGIYSDGDFDTDEPIIIGLYGGYCYLNLSYLRMMGVRAPGSSAEAIDVSFFGEGDPPPYAARKGDKSVRASGRQGVAQNPEDRPGCVGDQGTPADCQGELRPHGCV